MSTKPSNLFGTYESPVLPALTGEDLYTSFLSAETQHGIVYSVRAFYPPTDLPLINDWLNSDYGGLLPADGLEDYYTSMIGSDSVRPFIGLMNGVPVCLVELYKARQHELSVHYPSKPDDYGLYWQVAPGIRRDQMTGLLRTCLDYFFSFPEAGRILADADATDSWGNELFQKTGFVFLQKIAVPYRASNLYCCTRDDLRKMLFHS